MTCPEFEDGLIAVVFGEPDDAEQARLNEHLASCAACRDEERMLLRLRADLAGGEESPDQGLRERIRRAASRRASRGLASWALRPVPAYVAAAACVAVAVLAGTLPRRGGEPPAARAERVVLRERSPSFVVAGSFETAAGEWRGPTYSTGTPERDSL
jgi:anti-sigma factor RsiW